VMLFDWLFERPFNTYKPKLHELPANSQPPLDRTP
jgi:hypothetical protein